MAGPERIDRFEIEAMLGAGAFATVWLARDPVLDLRVAIKVLADNWSRDPDIRRRFIDEARVLWQADSPRIVRVHHVSELPDGRPFFVMAWADRGTLRQRMDARAAAGTPFAVSEACAISAEMARAVADVHAIGRIHRDLKPGNILLRSTATRAHRAVHGLARDEQLVLADFGLARDIEKSAITLVSGSPAYVAPEQAAGLEQLTERADLFPIGLMALELLTGSTPGSRATMAEAASTERIDVDAHLRRCGVDAPEQLRRYLDHLLAPDPRHRPATAVEVADVLHGLTSPAAAGSLGTAGPARAAATPAAAAAPAGGGGGADAAATAVRSAISGPPGALRHGRGKRPPGADLDERRPDDRATAPAPGGAGAGRPTGARSPMRSRPVIALGALAGVALAVVAVVLVVSGLGDADDPGPTSTTASTAAPAGSASTTSSVVVETLPNPAADGQPRSIPLPARSVPTADDELRTQANVARTVDELVAFYRALDDPDWEVGEITVVDGEASFEMISASRIASVTLEPTATGAGEGITRIEAVYRDP